MGEVSVCFQIDTDNRENFPSGLAFHTFRKQRDTFYEILRIWEQNHLVPGWAFQVALGGKIRTMLTLHSDATNYSHFARLFKSQLLISCIQKGQQEDIVDDDNISILKTLKHVNPQKLTQLRKRLVTPLSSQNNVYGPSFPGTQEFFRDFILHAFNPIFYTHLENCLVHEITELNKTQFIGSEIEDSETIVDEQTQRTFITCVLSLRLLAKMLGLLVSLPYRLESGASKEIITSQIEIRSSVVPSLNLQICLQNAIKEGKMSLSIPWIVKYLAMMDIVSLRLPYYKPVLELLYYIYRSVSTYDFTSSDSLMSQQTALLLKSTLNWFFELPNFPKDFCLTWQEIYQTKELKTRRQFDKMLAQTYDVLSVEPVVSVTPTKYCLDKLDIIDDAVLCKCCPITDLKLHTMPTKNIKHNTRGPNKHITPVSSQLHKFGTNSSKHLELQLEEAFFHGQPASTRKTVDFVSERVASTCVKHICNTLLATARETNLDAFRELMKKKYKERYKETQTITNGNTDISEFKSSLVNEMTLLAAAASKNLKEQCERSIPQLCENRIVKSIESLLAEDSLLPVKEMCIKIAIRIAIERINQWIQSHIVGGSLFTKDMELEINRFLRNNNTVSLMQEKVHNSAAPAPCYVIDEIRSLIWDIIDNNGKNLTITSVTLILNKLYQTLNERADLVTGPEKILYLLSVDFSLFLVAHRMDLFTQDIQKLIIKIWTINNFKIFEADTPMLRLLSPRNVMLLAQPQTDESWLMCGRFLRRLLEESVLDIEFLSDQYVALFRHDWPVPILKQLSMCLNESIAGYKSTDEKTEKVRYLLGWIAETCREIEIGDDFL
ncbi:codanin-1 [Vespula pensylvanica]|uniref:Codanin-1 C-terminal domain-containing protein n=1 Tax=Vespula pensylvanica TaxID=30213 RepID=A0A834UB32_VESPE|nr:codanin-1 [Vespula pensylvanica]KAF7427264.1 hypothetical protein H0235_006958 [Vespula pensylvanica]